MSSLEFSSSSMSAGVGLLPSPSSGLLPVVLGQTASLLEQCSGRPASSADLAVIWPE